MFPEVDAFESFLSQIQPEPPEDPANWEEVACIQSTEAVDGSYLIGLSQVTFWHPADGISLSAVRRKISEVLSSRGHLSDEKVATTILALFARMKQKKDLSGVARINQLFERITTADLNEYVILGVPAHENFYLEAGPFRVGEVDWNKIQYQCEKAGSDAGKRWGSDLKKPRLSICRDFRKVPVIPWHVLDQSDVIHPKECQQLVNEYYRGLSTLYHPQFLEEFVKVQEITTALGGAWFDSDLIIRHFGRWMISIYLNVGGSNRGWVYGNRSAASELDFGGSNRAVGDTNSVLRRHFSIPNPNIDSVHPNLRNYLHFLAVARQHRSEGRISEGFLHLVIALDLVFGEKEKSTTAVSDRVAVLAHRGLGLSFGECRKLTKKIYDSRSKYVHCGEEATSDDWDRTFQICEIIAFVMLRRFQAVGHKPSRADENWLKKIDFVAAAFDSNTDLEPDQLHELGIARDEDFDVLDYHKLLNKGATGKEIFGQFAFEDWSFLHV